MSLTKVVGNMYSSEQTLGVEIYVVYSLMYNAPVEIYSNNTPFHPMHVSNQPLLIKYYCINNRMKAHCHSSYFTQMYKKMSLKIIVEIFN